MNNLIDFFLRILYGLLWGFIFSMFGLQDIFKTFFLRVLPNGGEANWELVYFLFFAVIGLCRACNGVAISLLVFWIIDKLFGLNNVFVSNFSGYIPQAYYLIATCIGIFCGHNEDQKMKDLFN